MCYYDILRRGEQREQAVREATKTDDDALRTYAQSLMDQDDHAIALGGRGLIDDPHWPYVIEAKRRGLVL